MPLLARLVLCAAFLPVGWAKLTKSVEFDPSQAVILSDLGVGSFWFAGTPEVDAAGAGSRQPQVDQAASTADAAAAEGTVPSGEPMRAKSLYRIALLLNDRGIPYACALAWLAAVTELVGGALILVGFLTRVWALGLLITMGTAFWLTSLDAIKTTWGFDLPVEIHNRVFVQCALGVLSMWVLLIGPGAVSLDTVLFSQSSAKGGGKSKPTASKPA